jgi:hypothetical protein
MMLCISTIAALTRALEAAGIEFIEKMEVDPVSGYEGLSTKPGWKAA